MAVAPFDKKFGPEIIGEIPAVPAVYFFYNALSELIYIGKAKNLRRRLSQYRNAKRRKKHYKMRMIVSEAARLEFRSCESDAEASLLEAELIQEKRPKWNVAGAFSFMYPMIGVRREAGHWSLCLTTSPLAFEGWEFFGAFRSRHVTGAAFFSLIRLLKYVAHPSRDRKLPVPKYSYVFHFRQLPETWDPLWKHFFKGESAEAMEQLVLGLVENAGARKAPAKIQKHLNDLKRLWRMEIQPLRRACSVAGYADYPVRQVDRDTLFVRAKFSPLSARPSAARR